MAMYRRLWVLLGIVGVCLMCGQYLQAQEGPTATPVQINLSTLIPPTAAPLTLPTATWTPPPAPLVQLEANETANVREQPDTSAAQLGVIRTGELYPVTGRYFLWYQFQFPASPNGRGWVFGELVTIIGDESAIPEIDPNVVPTLPPAVIGATATAGIITLTPGGILTATAAVSRAGQGRPLPGQTPDILPTFTYPPGIVPVAPTLVARRDAGLTATVNSPSPITSVISGDVPPLLPIAVLFLVGILGLVLGSLRR